MRWLDAPSDSRNSMEPSGLARVTMSELAVALTNAYWDTSTGRVPVADTVR